MLLSGETVFRTISNKILFAKYPMIDRIGSLDPNIPIWFIYGNESWVEKTGLRVKELRDSFVSVKVSLKFIYKHLMQLYSLSILLCISVNTRCWTSLLRRTPRTIQ